MSRGEGLSKLALIQIPNLTLYRCDVADKEQDVIDVTAITYHASILCLWCEYMSLLRKTSKVGE